VDHKGSAREFLHFDVSPNFLKEIGWQVSQKLLLVQKF
jgi:hypothetical protein